MNRIFSGCSSLLFLPDISKWKANNLKELIEIFYNCSSLSSIPDISKWNLKNVNQMHGIFYNCSSLSSIPDISKWDIIFNNYKGITLYNCTSLSSLPNMFKSNKELFPRQSFFSPDTITTYMVANNLVFKIYETYEKNINQINVEDNILN